MGLASALSTALTGLTAAEATIDVVGNNLANSNTVGFKASTANFATQFLQTQSLGSSPTANSGGTNPRQVGLGTMVSEITPMFTQGTLEISANPTDLSIQGEGFFMVEGGAGQTLFTRNGIFKFNAQNEMVTITGNRLLGFGIDDDFQIQRTTLEPIEIPLGAAAVAQPTRNAFVEGTLRPEGGLGTTAQRIQTGVLGTNFYSAPTTQASTELAAAPPVLASGTGGTSGGGGAMAPGTYEYRFVWADGSYAPPPPSLPPTLTEGVPSDVVTATVNGGDSSLNLTGIPVAPPSPVYDFVRIYRRETTGPATFNYIAEVSVGTATYADTMLNATALARPTLNETLLNGNYNYYVTFASTAGGPGAGIESRPSPITNPINVANGRILLSGLPTTDAANPKDAIWNVRRVYRNLATDDSTFHFIGEIADTTSAVTMSDNLPDTAITPNATIDLNGPKINTATVLTDVLVRDAAAYSQPFQAGTLEFTGRKGGRTLAMKEFTIDATTTVQQLVDFIDQSMGIQSTLADPINPVPADTPSGRNPGGMVSSDGRLIMTGNNGVDNAIDIALSGMVLVTGTGTQNVNLPWGVLQTAVGESAVTDFVAYDSLGIPLRVRLTTVMEERDSTSTTYRWFADSPDNDPDTGAEISVGTGRITFDGEGNIIAVSEATVSVDRRNVSSASPLEFEIDFSNISGLSGDESTMSVSRQDGSGAGVLTSFIVGEDGTIRGVFSNGVTRDLGQIRVARFANPAGLEQKGRNLFAEGVNSGLPVMGDPGSQGIGTIVAGAVELSNTDIGSNLIDLILASTMYRGNTRVITTVQQMIDELLSLRR